MAMAVRTALRTLVVLVVAVVLVSAGILAWMRFAPRQTPDGQSPLLTLGSSSLASFRHAFNGPSGHVRVLVLLSPT